MTDEGEMPGRVVPWQKIRAEILKREPKARPFLDILERYWKDGLAVETAKRLLSAYWSGNYVEAKRILYACNDISPDALIAADRQANEELAKMIEQEKKLHDFGKELSVLVLKVAVGAALAAVGL